MERRSRVPFGVFLFLAVALAAFHVAYVAFGFPISDAADYVTTYSLSLFLIWWIVTDARRAWGRTPCFDFGFLVGVTLPISLVWYLVWARGWKGLFMMAFLAVLANLPWIAGAVAWHFINGGD